MERTQPKFTSRFAIPQPGTGRRSKLGGRVAACATTALLTAGSAACAAVDVRTDGLPKAGPAETAIYTQHLHTLAGPYMEGRKPGTEGIERAAQYIQWNFEKLGLKPAFRPEQEAADGQTVLDAPTFRQPFRIGETADLKSQSLAMSAGGQRTTFTPGTDFNALGYGSEGTATLPVTFVGYSIPAGSDDYSSYDGQTDLTGQAAMMLRFEPMNDEGRSLWSDEGWSFAASLVSKFRAAESRGAEAILLVNPPMADDERAAQLETLESTQGSRPLGIPILHLTPETADRLVRAGGGESLAAMIAQANAGVAIAELEGVELAIDTKIEREPILTDNIGAILPGRGELANEYIVIGAHYDHLGVASFGSRFPGELHLGADDNASGSAGLLTAAGLLADAWTQFDGPVRSVLFLAFSAEESGLVGSRHYVRNPIVRIEDHYLMINMDMIGSLGATLEAGGVGTSDGLESLAASAFEKSELDIKTSLSVGSGRSDHASFDREGVPNIFFFTGITDQYHTPDDTADTINLEGGARIATLASDLALAAALNTGDLPYAEKKEDDEPQRQVVGGPSGVKVRVGIAPGDYSGEAGGIVVARVFDGTSAADAGLKEGDRITVWNGEVVKTVEDWMPLLASHNPGDTIDITVVRDGEEVVMPMTLKARQTTGG